MQKKIIKIYTLIFVIFVSSCDLSNYSKNSEDDPCNNPDYSDCNSKEPFMAPLKISLTINEENPNVSISVYIGKYEDNNKIDSFKTDKTFIEKEVPIGEDYAVVAKYISKKDTIMALDGTKIKKKSKTNCDSTCWTVSGGEINLKL